MFSLLLGSLRNCSFRRLQHSPRFIGFVLINFVRSQIQFRAASVFLHLGKAEKGQSRLTGSSDPLVASHITSIQFSSIKPRNRHVGWDRCWNTTPAQVTCRTSNLGTPIIPNPWAHHFWAYGNDQRSSEVCGWSSLRNVSPAIDHITC